MYYWVFKKISTGILIKVNINYFRVLSSKGRPDIVGQLLRYGANRALLTEKGQSALMVSVARRRAEFFSNNFLRLLERECGLHSFYINYFAVFLTDLNTNKRVNVAFQTPLFAHWTL